jgi:Na+/H+-translocating membrane pyrophosphatase
MYGNGALIGIVIAITVNLHKMIRKAQIQVPVAFFVAAVGSTSTPIVGLRFASGTIRTAGPTTSGSGWCVLLSDYS